MKERSTFVLNEHVLSPQKISSKESLCGSTNKHFLTNQKKPPREVPQKNSCF